LSSQIPVGVTTGTTSFTIDQYTLNNSTYQLDENATYYFNVLVENSSYYATLYTANSAMTTDGVPVGIADVQANTTLQIFPNPVVNGEFTIQNAALKAGDKVTIIDLQGRVIVNKVQLTVNNSINVSALPQGVYLVRVGDRTTKLVIN
jgi:hypothetical protein